MKAVGVLLSMLGLAACALAADSDKKVFAHYMVCMPTYGGDSTVADYQREIRAAQAAGIDGFALNCGGRHARTDRGEQSPARPEVAGRGQDFHGERRALLPRSRRKLPRLRFARRRRAREAV